MVQFVYFMICDRIAHCWIRQVTTSRMVFVACQYDDINCEVTTANIHNSWMWIDYRHAYCTYIHKIHPCTIIKHVYTCTYILKPINKRQIDR